MKRFEPMTREERSLYNHERALIGRRFPGLAAREIQLDDGAADFDGRAREPRLILARRVLDLAVQERESLLTHLLIHYELKDAGRLHWRGHGPEFVKRARALGVYGEAVTQRCFSIEDWLEDPTLRSGPHAVNARVIDVVFGLAAAYEEELNDFFMNERWLRGGHRFPDGLLPFVKFYSEELTDLLAVTSTVSKLTTKQRR
jgi:hypothetical protein